MHTHKCTCAIKVNSKKSYALPSNINININQAPIDKILNIYGKTLKRSNAMAKKTSYSCNNTFNGYITMLSIVVIITHKEDLDLNSRALNKSIETNATQCSTQNYTMFIINGWVVHKLFSKKKMMQWLKMFTISMRFWVQIFYNHSFKIDFIQENVSCQVRMVGPSFLRGT